MNCRKCGSPHFIVIDSRTTSDGNAIYRRRKCLDCGARVTTFERVDYTDAELEAMAAEQYELGFADGKETVLKAMKKAYKEVIAATKGD